MTDSTERLNKHLALTLGFSRREADDLIASGKVLVNDMPAQLGARIALSDTIVVDGSLLEATPDYRYIVFHKPVGFICSRRSQGDTPTIYDLLPKDMWTLKPVGRLDKDSSGILLMTNDGNFAHTMTHPSFKKVKVYEATLDIPLAPLHQQMISDYGIEIGDGSSTLSLERNGEDRRSWVVTMSEGRNRQIRRTFVALGYTVTALHRITFGPFGLGSLPAGKTIVVTP